MKFWRAPRQPCIGLAACAAAAVLLADRLAISPGWLLAGIAFSAGAFFLAPRAGWMWLTCFATFFLRHELARDNSGRDLAQHFGDAPRIVSGTGVVLDEPREIEALRNVTRCRFSVQLETISLDRAQPCSAKALVVWSGAAPIYGDRISFTGDAQNLPPARNPGMFDYAKMLQRRGIFSEIHLRFPTDGRVLDHGGGNPIIVFAHRTRAWMSSRLTLDLEDQPELAGLVQGMVLGLKDETPEETREMFERTGTLHLFVVNGLHVGMFAAIAWFLLKPFGVRRRTAVFILVPILAFYALVTGLSPGSIRATVMAAILLGGAVAERNPLSFNSLAAAGLVILLFDTNQLFMPGFQFSFGVVFAIMLLAGRLRRLILPAGAPDPFLPRLVWNRRQLAQTFVWEKIASLVAVTTSATIGSSPFTATYFHLLSPSSLVANLIAVPLALVLLFEGVLSMLAGLFSSGLSMVFNNVNFVLGSAILAIIEFFAALPGGHLYLELPRFRAPCEIMVFDLGAGGAIHLRSGRRDWLIDCGNAFSYENIVRPFLRMRGADRLSGLLLTHGDAGHMGAARTALLDFWPREIVDSPMRDRSANRRAFHAELAARQLGKSIVAAGDRLRLSPDVTARVLHPPAGGELRVADDKALVLQLETPGCRILFMSDGGFVTERWLLAHEPDLRSDILVKGQHAADASGLLEFIDAVQPRVIVCSGAPFPPREQISGSWAREVTARGITLFRQDQTGAVEIALRPGEWRVRPFLGDQTFRSRKE